MYKIIVRNYTEPTESIATDGFKRIWVEEEFENNELYLSDIQYETSSLSDAVQTFVDNYAEADIREYGGAVHIDTYALYNDEFDEYIAFSKCDIEPFDKRFAKGE